MYHIVLVLGVLQSDSVFFFFSDDFPLQLLQDIDYSSLRYTVNPYCSPILCMGVCIC